MKELNILLSCSYGFSTSILTSKMEKYFKEKNYPFKVEALAETNALDQINRFDVILIGPQVKYLLPKFSNAVNGLKPVYVMDSRAYGMQNVEAIIEAMLEEMELDEFYE